MRADPSDGCSAQSSKAKEARQGERYAQLTAENAAASLKREASAKPQFRPT